MAGRVALYILVIGQVLNAAAGPVGYLLILTGHERVCASVYGWSAVLNVGLNLMLIPPLGSTGAALATASTMALWNVWLSVLVLRRLGIRLLPLLSRRERPD